MNSGILSGILSHSGKHIKGSKQEWYYRSNLEAPLTYTYTEI